MRLLLAWLLLGMAGMATPAVAADPPLDALLSDLQLVSLAGPPPPPFELERLGDGKKVTLAEHRGQPLLLYFWATW